LAWSVTSVLVGAQGAGSAGKYRCALKRNFGERREITIELLKLPTKRENARLLAMPRASKFSGHHVKKEKRCLIKGYTVS
jgi:hypothetical protein